MKMNNILCGLTVALFAISANAETKPYRQTLDSIERQIRTEMETYAEQMTNLNKAPRCVSAWRVIFDPTCDFQNKNMDFRINQLKITHEANMKVLQSIKEGIIAEELKAKEIEDYKFMKGL